MNEHVSIHSRRQFATVSGGQKGQCDHKCGQQLSEWTTVESVIENSSQIGPEPNPTEVKGSVMSLDLTVGCQLSLVTTPDDKPITTEKRH